MGLFTPPLSGYAKRQVADGESFVRVEHRHPLTVAVRLAGPALLALAGLVLIPGAYVAFADGAALAGALCGVVLAAIGAAGSAIAYLRWRYEEYVLTTRRVIRVAGVLDKTVADSALEKINDITMAQSFLGRYLGYGTLEIMTAAEETRAISELAMIRDPDAFKRDALAAKFRMMGRPE